MFGVLCGYLTNLGVERRQTLNAAFAKLEVNKKRTWPKAEPGEPTFHTKESDVNEPTVGNEVV